MSDYFELYHLPVGFRPDLSAVKRQFYALSKRYHPDRFAQASAEEQAEALQMAAVNNEAYKVLTDPDKTMAYVLELKGHTTRDEVYKLPADFLMEMLELNEAVSDAEAMPEDTAVLAQARSLLDGALLCWEEECRSALETFEQEGEAESALVLLKDLYFRKKYLLRIQERLSTFASR